jgi:hypothetical protein
MADVERLAREDWPRYARWDAQQKKIAANDRAPELADKSTAEKLTKAAHGYLGDIGFKPEELAQAWNGEASFRFVTIACSYSSSTA